MNYFLDEKDHGRKGGESEYQHQDQGDLDEMILIVEDTSESFVDDEDAPEDTWGR